MSKAMKNGLAALTSMCLVSCSFSQSPPGLSPDKIISKSNVVIQPDKNTIILDAGNGKKGAGFSLVINFPESSPGFKTAANSNGSIAKSFADIQSYQVYLVQNSSLNGYPPGGDPLGNSDLVSGPFTVTNGGSPLINLYFSNVASSGSNAYYVAVRAMDSGGNDLIMVNNGSATAWTGSTAAANGQVAVSAGAGITVNSALVVSTTTPLSVVPRLLNATGASLQAQIVPSPGFTPASAVNGFVIPSIGEFKVNTYTTASQFFPAAAMDSNGDFVIAWTSDRQDGSAYGVYAQRYNADGTARIPGICNLPVCNPVTGEFKVNTYTRFDQRYPSVAIDRDGDFIIAWESNQDPFNFVSNGNTYESSTYGIFAQRYNSAGIAQGAEFEVNTNTTANQEYPSTAMDINGNFVIAWQSSYQDGSGYGIFAQRYNSVGIQQGAEFKVNSFTSGNQRSPALAMDNSGDFVITWNGTGTGDDYGIFAQRYNSSGVAQGGEFRVNNRTTENQGAQSVAMDSNGDFVIAWESQQDPFIFTYHGISYDAFSFGISAQRYNAAGIAQGSEFKVNTYTDNNQRDPAVAMDSSGNFVIAWESGGQDSSLYGVYGQRYSAVGQAQGSEFQVNTFTSLFQNKPAVAMDSSGDFIISWQSGNYGLNTQDGLGYGVYAQRYNALGAAK
jgi:hypothetical protein